MGTSLTCDRKVRGVSVVTAHTRQSIGLPIALPGPGQLEGGGERPRAASPDTGKAVGNPIDCRICAVTPGTTILKDFGRKQALQIYEVLRQYFRQHSLRKFTKLFLTVYGQSRLVRNASNRFNFPAWSRNRLRNYEGKSSVRHWASLELP